MKTIYLIAIVLFFGLTEVFPQAAFTVKGSFCKNNELRFNDASAVTASAWVWDFGDSTPVSTEQNPTHTYTDTGLFTITLTITSNGTQFNAKPLTKRISSNPKVAFRIDSTTFFYSSYTRIFVNSSTTDNPVSNLIWDFGDGSAAVSTNDTSYLYKYSGEGTYTTWLKVIDNEGCTDSASVSFEIYDKYYVPNVFTPNNDTKNDQFIVTSNGSTLFSIEIYSRWGNMVFKREGHQQIIWDGQMPDGSLVKPGTYYYIISSVSGNNTYDPKKGFITVFY